MFNAKPCYRVKVINGLVQWTATVDVTVCETRRDHHKLMVGIFYHSDVVIREIC